MKKRSVITLMGVALVALFVLMGCGLNQRSAADNEPVPVEVNTDNAGENNGAGENTDNGAQDDGQAPAEGDQNNGETGDGSTDPEQPAQEGNGEDGYVAPETPREEENGDGNEDGSGEQTPQEATAVPPTEVPATAVPATPIPQGSTGSHVVAAGDTLFSIAQLYGLTVTELAAANGIVNPNVIDVGQELVIPAPGTVTIPETASTHIVSYGETLFSIARAYGFTVDELAIHNNISNVNRIDVGQEIKIPSR